MADHAEGGAFGGDVLDVVADRIAPDLGFAARPFGLRLVFPGCVRITGPIDVRPRATIVEALELVDLLNAAFNAGRADR